MKFKLKVHDVKNALANDGVDLSNEEAEQIFNKLDIQLIEENALFGQTPEEQREYAYNDICYAYWTEFAPA